MSSWQPAAAFHRESEWTASNPAFDDDFETCEVDRVFVATGQKIHIREGNELLIVSVGRPSASETELALAELKKLFPKETCYNVETLADPDSGDQIIDCEIQTTLDVDDANARFEQFIESWCLRGSEDLVFTLKFV